MRKPTIAKIAAAVGLLILAGCAATYNQPCRVRLESDPPGAEIWKGGYYIGTTPYVLHYTATSEDDDRGYLRLPPLTMKKPGYRPYLVEMELDLKEGYDWEGQVILEPEDQAAEGRE
ncbi:MAG: hypothetical protein P9M08_11850 [Candidatus Erginobacter occultus]|nr:hypothetical protein [Candidatus Erginobacter occultus]